MMRISDLHAVVTYVKARAVASFVAARAVSSWVYARAVVLANDILFRRPADSVAAADEGVLVCQDYAEDYFAEDYVGERRDF